MNGAMSLCEFYYLMQRLSLVIKVFRAVCRHFYKDVNFPVINISQSYRSKISANKHFSADDNFYGYGFLYGGRLR